VGRWSSLELDVSLSRFWRDANRSQVSTMMTRLHRKQYGDSSMADQLSKHSTRHRMELMMRQLALVQHRCDKFRDGLEERELLLKRMRRDAARRAQAGSSAADETAETLRALQVEKVRAAGRVCV